MERTQLAILEQPVVSDSLGFEERVKTTRTVLALAIHPAGRELPHLAASSITYPDATRLESPPHRPPTPSRMECQDCQTVHLDGPEGNWHILTHKDTRKGLPETSATIRHPMLFGDGVIIVLTDPGG